MERENRQGDPDEWEIDAAMAEAAGAAQGGAVVVEAEAPVVEGADDLVALAAQIEARRREGERALDEELDAAFAALVEGTICPHCGETMEDDHYTCEAAAEASETREAKK